MTWLPDPTLERLRSLAASPEGADVGDRYEILEVVGEGAMGTVHRARDTVLGREVAVKILRVTEGAAPADGAALAERMRREALILARLEHPGIVPVHDAGVLPDGRIYYAMRLVRGKRLDEAAGERTTRDETLRTFVRICEAVAFAHAHGVIHRDLKPENVMVGPFGEVLVMDWGVARLLGAPDESGTVETAATAPRETAAGAVIGTPGYMAPEQAAGGADQADQRSDVFSLGALLVFLLAGSHPTAAGPVPPAGIPKPLTSIIRRAIAPAPPDRYQGVADLLSDLTRYISGGRVLAHRESIPERVARVLRPYRVAIVLIVGYLLMRAALLLWTRR